MASYSIKQICDDRTAARSAAVLTVKIAARDLDTIWSACNACHHGAEITKDLGKLRVAIGAFLLACETNQE